jgi:hypothetical protein
MHALEDLFYYSTLYFYSGEILPISNLLLQSAQIDLMSDGTL